MAISHTPICIPTKEKIFSHKFFFFFCVFLLSKEKEGGKEAICAIKSCICLDFKRKRRLRRRRRNKIYLLKSSLLMDASHVLRYLLSAPFYDVTYFKTRRRRRKKL